MPQGLKLQGERAVFVPGFPSLWFSGARTAGRAPFHQQQALRWAQGLREEHTVTPPWRAHRPVRKMTVVTILADKTSKAGEGALQTSWSRKEEK